MFGQLKAAKAEFDTATQLTAMANVFEAIERTRQTHMIGAGGGIDSLPHDQRDKAMRTLQKGMTVISKVPPAIVTRELVKNLKVADSLGRAVRVQGMLRMLEILAEDGVAQPLDEFVASHS